MARLHFAYPRFKTYHFAPCTSIYYPPWLPTWPSNVSLTPFYSKLEYNTDQTTKIHSLFFTSPRNAKIIVTKLEFWFFWLCFRVRVRFWLWVVLRHWIFEDRSSLGTTFLRWGFKFWAGVSSSELGFQVLMVALIIDVFFEWKLLRFKWAYVYIWDLCAENKSDSG